jgi:hypothetical protein
VVILVPLILKTAGECDCEGLSQIPVFDGLEPGVAGTQAEADILVTLVGVGSPQRNLSSKAMPRSAAQYPDAAALTHGGTTPSTFNIRTKI